MAMIAGIAYCLNSLPIVSVPNSVAFPCCDIKLFLRLKLLCAKVRKISVFRKNFPYLCVDDFKEKMVMEEHSMTLAELNTWCGEAFVPACRMHTGYRRNSVM